MVDGCRRVSFLTLRVTVADITFLQGQSGAANARNHKTRLFSLGCTAETRITVQVQVKALDPRNFRLRFYLTFFQDVEGHSSFPSSGMIRSKTLGASSVVMNSALPPPHFPTPVPPARTLELGSVNSFLLSLERYGSLCVSIRLLCSINETFDPCRYIFEELHPAQKPDPLRQLREGT